MKEQLLATVLVAMCASAACLEATDTQSVFANRIDESKRAVGMVVGVIDGHGHYVVGRGRLEQSRAAQSDGDTTFEIGSIAKVFTSFLLADMVERGEVKIDDPVTKCLPATVTAPTRDGREITLQDLSTQISGLSSLPRQSQACGRGKPIR